MDVLRREAVREFPCLRPHLRILVKRYVLHTFGVPGHLRRTRQLFRRERLQFRFSIKHGLISGSKNR